MNRILAAAFSLAVIAASALIQSTPAYAVEPSMFGTVLDVNTRLPVNNVCVTVGPPVRCATNTKADGTWSLDMTGAPNGIQWDVRLLLGGQIKAEFLGINATRGRGRVIAEAAADAVSVDVMGGESADGVMLMAKAGVIKPYPWVAVFGKEMPGIAALCRVNTVPNGYASSVRPPARARTEERRSPRVMSKVPG